MRLSTMISMYDPDNIDAKTQLYEILPREMMDAFGYGDTATDLASFIGLYYYGFIVMLFPLIYCIIMANRLVAALVDRGSMAYLPATPNTRAKIITAQAVFMAIGVIALLAVNTASGLALSKMMFPGEMDISAFLVLNLVTVMLNLAISSICFFFSCLFNEAKYSLALDAGIPILFFVINMLRNIGNGYEWLGYLTIYSLFDPGAILNGKQPAAIACLVFSAITLALYGTGTFLFSRRNLYL